MKVSNIENKNLRLFFDYDLELKNRVKSELVGCKWVAELKSWVCVYNNLNIEWLIENGFKFDFAYELKPWTVFESNPRFVGELMEYQRGGVERMINFRHCVNGMKPGRGKTPQAICATDTLRGYPALVVTIAIAKINWQREYKKFMPDVTTYVVTKKNEIPPVGFDVYIVNYHLLFKRTKKDEDGGTVKKKRGDDTELIQFLKSVGFKTIVVDESHYMKSYRAKWNQILNEIKKKSCPENIFLLTGTAVKNNPSDLVQQLKFLDALEYFGGYIPFIIKYCGGKRNRWGGWDANGATNLGELHEKLVSLCYVPDDGQEIEKQLPPVSHIDVWVDAASKEYRALEKDMAELYAEKKKEGGSIRRQIAAMNSDEREFFIENCIQESYEKAGVAQSSILSKLTALRKQLAEDKYFALKEWLDNYGEERPDEPLIIFGWFQDPLYWIADDYKIPVITGKTSPVTRQKNIDDFQSGKTKMIVLNIQAGGTAINLTAAKNIVYLELPWSGADYEQSFSRMRRIGNVHDHLSCYRLLSTNTTDEYMQAVLNKKELIGEAVLGGVENVQSSIDYFREMQKIIFKRALNLKQD